MWPGNFSAASLHRSDTPSQRVTPRPARPPHAPSGPITATRIFRLDSSDRCKGDSTARRGCAWVAACRIEVVASSLRGPDTRFAARPTRAKSYLTRIGHSGRALGPPHRERFSHEKHPDRVVVLFVPARCTTHPGIRVVVMSWHDVTFRTRCELPPFIGHQNRIDGNDRETKKPNHALHPHTGGIGRSGIPNGSPPAERRALLESPHRSTGTSDQQLV